jgi:hypothetical protein
MHNVLKGIRTLSPEAADRLMHALDLTIPQVLWAGAGAEVSAILPVPLLRHRIGPGTTASFTAFRGYIPFVGAFVAPLTQPLAAYLGADLALPAECRAGDLVLLDQNPALRAIPAPASCWVVADNAGLRVRYVRRTRGGLAVSGDRDLPDEEGWQTMLFHGRNILDIVRARIVWIGREMDTSTAGPAGPAR